jgi:hypothetical protein
VPSGLIVRMGLCRDDKSTGLFQQQSRMNQARTNRYRGCRSQCPLKASSPRGVTRHAIASARHDQLRDVTGLSIRWEKVPWGTERSQAAVRTAAPRCRVKSVITDSFARFTARDERWQSTGAKGYCRMRASAPAASRRTRCSCGDVQYPLMVCVRTLRQRRGRGMYERNVRAHEGERPPPGGMP